jgi:hypothetical protein
MCAKYTPQSNGLILFACHASRSKPNLGALITYKHVFNLRNFQSKWLQINPIIITFLADFVPFNEKFISSNLQIQMPQNFMEICFTKLSSSCKNLSFIWLLNFYQISILPPQLHAKNCRTIADKIYSKTETFLI